MADNTDSVEAVQEASPAKPARTDPSVFNFVRGLDLSGNRFGNNEENFPEKVGDMANLVWLKLNRTDIKAVPSIITNAQRLEDLSLSRNKLTELPGELVQLKEIHTINARHNKIVSSGLHGDVFRLSNLTTLDLSFNDLTELPVEISHARHLLVLSLAHNKLNANPECLPSKLFMNCTDIQYLDLGHNQLDSLPVQLRRLAQLDTLIVRDNPLATHNFLRPVFALTSLRVLDMSNTQRSLENLPESFMELVQLEELDLSRNHLGSFPSYLFALTRLKRLNLSECGLTSVPAIIQQLSLLTSLNLSDNALQALPTEIGNCRQLTRLFLNGNQITGDSETLPLSMSKLTELQVLNLSHNQLRTFPLHLAEIQSLRVIRLSGNNLLTLPVVLWNLPHLTTLITSNNPDLVLPNRRQARNLDTTYGVDWRASQHLSRQSHAQDARELKKKESLSSQKRKALLLAGGTRSTHTDQDAEMVLLGMRKASKHSLMSDEDMHEHEADGSEGPQEIVPKKWNEVLKRPKFDYSDLFTDDIGEYRDDGNNIHMWRIENFVPIEVEEALHGHFFEADCYIVLSVELDESYNNKHSIYFWIGRSATLDKKASAAINAVSLRNHIGATCMAQREEEGDESDEFLLLFNNDLVYVHGGTESGFFTVEPTEYRTTLYQLRKTKDPVLDSVQVAPESLSTRNSYILDAGLQIFAWCGSRCPNISKSKARLLADKINKLERQMKAKVLVFNEGDEPKEFWKVLGGERSDEFVAEDEQRAIEAEKVEEEAHKKAVAEQLARDGVLVSEAYQPHVVVTDPQQLPRLYRAMLGKGYLELPQVTPYNGILTHELLDKKGVYILDTHADIFVWIGHKSARILRAAGIKLGNEILRMLTRSSFCRVLKVMDMAETVAFRSHFKGWDDVIGVDHTRPGVSAFLTVKQLQERVKAEPPPPKELESLKADLSQLFKFPTPLLNVTEAMNYMKVKNEMLEKMECFVLEGQNFVRLPKEEVGQFHASDCYVFLCTYWVEDLTDDAPSNNDQESGHMECTVYFWQGRFAANMGWLTFKFSFLPGIEQLVSENFKCELTVLREWQQRESPTFLAHFKQKFIIHNGSRKAPPPEKPLAALYRIVAIAGPHTVRCVQLPEAKADLLMSRLCYLLRVPFDAKTGVLYVWLGKHAGEHYKAVATKLGQHLRGKFTLQTVNEGEEPDNFFWVGIGGRKPYPTEPLHSRARLFQCSNALGYFCVTEMDPDFCQDDLVVDDCFILDTGKTVYTWIGPAAADVEAKLAIRAAKAYLDNLEDSLERGPPVNATPGKEPQDFKDAFAIWNPAGPRRIQREV